MNALKYQTIIKNGQLELPPLNLPEGTVVEAILLIQEPDPMDETDYLLSTEANRQHLKEAVELLRNPDNYIYVDPAQL
jgi:hypothetical protein